MVNYPPLMPSSGWFVSFLKFLSDNMEESEAIVKANEIACSPKDFGRFNLRDAQGNILTLSLAVDGGGRQLRSFNKIVGLKLSEHGEWRRNHLKAMEACLGKKPFFNYYYPKISEIYLDRNLVSLQDFNTAIFRILYSFIKAECSVSDLKSFYANGILLERGKEVKDKIDFNISSFEPLTSLGKETLLGFLAINL